MTLLLRTADKADGFVVPAQLQDAILWECESMWLAIPVFQILLQTEVKMSIMASFPARTNSAGVLSTPADFPIFCALTATSRRLRWCSSSDICGQSSTVRSPSVSSKLYSVHLVRISCSSVRHFSFQLYIYKKWKYGVVLVGTACNEVLLLIHFFYHPFCFLCVSVYNKKNHIHIKLGQLDVSHVIICVYIIPDVIQCSYAEVISWFRKIFPLNINV